MKLNIIEVDYKTFWLRVHQFWFFFNCFHNTVTVL